MRFALLGDHPDGLDMARALTDSGRHELLVYSGPPLGLDYLRRWHLDVTPVGDLEEVLADPLIEGLILASGPALRPGQLRRALQSERHVLCVHPVADGPDLAYEASLMQQDTGKLLLPLLNEALHPAAQRLAHWIHAALAQHAPAEADAPIESITAAGPRRAVSAQRLALVRTPRPGTPRCVLGIPLLLQIEWASTDTFLLETDGEDRKPSVPGWDTLRLLGGEVAEVAAMAPGVELAVDQPLLMTGRFVTGWLFQATFLAGQAEARWSLIVQGSQGQVSLKFPEGWPGPAQLSYVDEHGRPQLEEWPPFNPWAAMVDAVDAALAALPARPEPVGTPESLADLGVLNWLDEVRALELDDAVRRSLARRRSIILDFQDISEEVTFKGTMALLGCSLILASVMLLVLSVWAPWLGWLVLPIFGIFLVLQLLRWVLPVNRPAEEPSQRL